MSPAPLGYTVHDVIGRRAQEEMIGPYAQRRITMVTDEGSCGDGAKVNFPGKTVY